MCSSLFCLILLLQPRSCDVGRREGREPKWRAAAARQSGPRRLRLQRCDPAGRSPQVYLMVVAVATSQVPSASWLLKIVPIAVLISL
jgi:hypothetical protein